MAKATIHLDLGVGGPHFDFGDLWDEPVGLHDVHIDLWKQVGTLFNSYQLAYPEIEYNDTKCYEVSMDTAGFIAQIEDSRDFYVKVIKHGYSAESVDRAGDGGKLPLIINIAGGTEETVDHTAFGAIRCFLEDLFLAMNICAPGSLSLFKSILKVDTKEIDVPSYDSSLLESAWIHSKEWGWPQFEVLPLESTWKWIEKVGLRNTQVAKTSAQKALITLLNICSYDDLHGLILMLLDATHALEGLLVDRDTGIIRLLRDRLTLILGAPSSDKKWLSHFYDLRSRYIHGDFPVIRMHANEGLDSEVMPYFKTIMQPAEKALLVFLALLKHMARNSIGEFKFSETVEYIKV